MIYRAKHRYADVSARKIRPFAQLVRGKNVDEALEALRFVPNRGAKQLAEVLKSAVGNAEEQGCRNLDDLVVTEARVDGGPMFKRIRPRARGTAFGIKRRLAHIVVSLTDFDAVEQAAAVAAAQPTAATAPTP
jgi:large subunit ribosomal protein L22